MVGTAGRQATVAIPVRVAGHLQAALVGAVRDGGAMDAEAIAVARLLGVHTGACLEMVMATTAARELAMLEMSSVAVAEEAPRPPVPAPGPRFDVLRSLATMLAGAPSETAIAHAVVGELRGLIEYDSCRFYLRAPDGDLLVPLAQSGLAPVYSGDSAEALIVAVGEGSPAARSPRAGRFASTMRQRLTTASRSPARNRWTSRCWWRRWSPRAARSGCW